MTAAVEVFDLWRRFDAVEAVRGVSFSLARGEVLGFIGANGAGKTTTMRMMATLDVPSAGRIRICGRDVLEDPLGVRRAIGWMPDSFGAYANVTVWEYLDFFARAYGYAGAERKRRVDEVVAFTELGELLTRDMAKLSKGMSQRLCLGRALLHDPEVLILDEPAAGLDPRARVEFKRLVRLLAEAGKALFISSHILSELEEMCDTLLFIDRGAIVHFGSAASLKQGETPSLSLTVLVTGDVEPLRTWVLMNPGFTIAEEVRGGLRLGASSAEPDFLAERLRAMVHAGVRVVEFRREERRLEDAFVDVLDRARNEQAG